MLRKLFHLLSVLLLLVVVGGCSDAEIQAFIDSLTPEQRQQLQELIDENPDLLPPGIVIPDSNPPETPTGVVNDPEVPGDPPIPGGGDDPFEFPTGDLDPSDPIIPTTPTDPPGGGDPPIVDLDSAFVPEPATAATALVGGLVLVIRGRRRRD